MRPVKSARSITGVLIISLCFLLSIPFVASAAEYTRLGTLASVADEPHQTLNTVKVSVDAGELKAGDTVLVSLPKDFSFNVGGGSGRWSQGSTGSGDVYYGNYDNGCYIYVPWDEENSLNMAVGPGGTPAVTDIFTVNELRENEISITVNDIDGYPSITHDGYFYIYLKDVDVAKGYKGAISLSFHAPGGSGFGGGEVAGGRVGRLEVDVDKSDADDDNSDQTGTAEPETGTKDGLNGDTSESQGTSTDLVPEKGNVSLVFTVGSKSYYVNGKVQTMDTAPFIKNGRTYLPLRFVADAFGVPSQGINWADGTATFDFRDKKVSVSPGSKTIVVNGAVVSIDAAPEVVSGRLMLPVRWVATAFGLSVTWNGSQKTVTIR